MKRVRVLAFVVGVVWTAAVSHAGVITSIQRLDDSDVSSDYFEQLVPNGFVPGAQIWSDRTFTYGQLPTFLNGIDYVRTVNQDQIDGDYQLQLNFNQPATVYMILDDRLSTFSAPPAWISQLGFTDTGTNLVLADHTSSVFSGTFMGQVVLREIGNETPQMYTVGATTQPSSGNVIITQNTTIGTTTVDSLTLQATTTNVDLTQNTGTVLTINQGLITKNGPFSSTISGGNLATPSGAFNIAVNGGLLKIASNLTGSTNKLNLTGPGTLELTSIDPANNFGGGIFLNSGALRISDPRNLGGTSNNPNTINFNGGALESLQNALTLTNVMTLGAGGGTLRPANATSVLMLPNDGQLVGAGSLVKDGAGILKIAGSNTYQGPVSVTAGTLELQNAGALGGLIGNKSPITLANSTALNLHSDLSFLFYNDPIALTGNAAIDVGRLNMTTGGDFFLNTLSIPTNPNGTPTTIRVTNSTADASALHFVGQVMLNGDGVVDASTGTFLEGPIKGVGGLTKMGTSMLTLGGSASNTYANPTSVLQGTLALAKASGAISIPTDLLINGGGVRLDSDNQIADISNINLLQGQFNLNSSKDTVATLTVAGGNVITGAGRLLIGGPGGAAIPSSLPGSPVGASPLAALVISGGNTTINLGGEINATSVLVSGGVNTVQAGGLLTVGTGGLTLSGDLSPSILLQSDASNSGRMVLSGNVSFTGLLGTAALDSSGAAAQPGRIDLNLAERNFSVNDGAAAVDLRISATLMNGALKKSGTGTLRLTGANTYAGGTTISDGVLEVSNSAALGTGPLNFNSGQLSVKADLPPTFTTPLTLNGDATLNVDRDTPAGGSSGVVQFTGGLSIGASQLMLTGANRSIKFTGTTTLTGAAKFNNSPAVDVAFSSPIIQSAGTWGMTKDGLGKVTLDGATSNTYTGSTRINSGTVELNKTPGVNAVPANLDIFGGTVRLLASNQIADTSAVTVSNAASSLDLNSNSDTIASLNGTAGSVALGTGTLTVTQGTYGGVISGSGRLIQDNPAGGTSANLTLTAAQTFTGGVTVNHGAVNFSAQAPDHVGTTLTGGTWQVFNGSSLNFNAGSNILTNAANVTLDGPTSSFSKFDSLTSNLGNLTISSGKNFTATGPFTNSGTMSVGVGSTLTVNGGLTNGGALTAIGTFAAAGTINTSGALTLSGPQAYAPGTTLNVTGGITTLNTDSGAPSDYRLSINNSGGSLVFSSAQHLANLSISGTVVAAAPPAGASTPAPPPAAPASAGGSVLVTQALSLSGSGTLDLVNNALVVDYTSGGPATFNAVKAAIVSGYNASGTHWTGTGITSSSARDSSSTGIGFAEASSLLGPSGGMFRGESVDGTAVLARFTLLGDATLDGAVDFNDLVKLAQNYNTSGTTWTGGDFTYDGVTDFNDLVKLAQNYNTALPSAPIPGAPAIFEQDFARALAQVPEPQSLALLGIAAACLLGRRRGDRNCPA